ncbi:hypothetical protein E5Q_04671, partial [Mixia osmundae IAM 14324]
LSSRPRLTLYVGGPECTLCEEALEKLESMPDQPDFDLQVYNIRDDRLPDVKIWRRRYQYDIPVLHLGNEQIMKHRIDTQKLSERLRAWSNTS